MSRKMTIKNQKGFASLVEVVVTAVIFILATVGILSTVSSLRPQTTESRKKVEAAYVGKGILDELRKEVDASMPGWFGPNLAIGTHTISSLGPNGEYTASYQVTAHPTIPNLRKVDITITFPDE